MRNTPPTALPSTRATPRSFTSSALKSMALARFIAKLFSRSRSNSSTSPPPEAPHLRLGRHGERLAARHLRRLGFKVLYRNFRPTTRRRDRSRLPGEEDPRFHRGQDSRTRTPWDARRTPLTPARRKPSSAARNRGCGCWTNRVSQSASILSRSSLAPAVRRLRLPATRWHLLTRPEI